MSLAPSKNLSEETPDSGLNATAAAPPVASGPTKLRSVIWQPLLTWKRSKAEFDALTWQFLSSRPSTATNLPSTIGFAS